MSYLINYYYQNVWHFQIGWNLANCFRKPFLIKIIYINVFFFLNHFSGLKRMGRINQYGPTVRTTYVCQMNHATHAL